MYLKMGGLWEAFKVLGDREVLEVKTATQLPPGLSVERPEGGGVKEGDGDKLVLRQSIPAHFCFCTFFLALKQPSVILWGLKDLCPFCSPC